MPLSDEQKAKMAAGRAAGAVRRAAEKLAAAAKDATAMPAGHARDEQIRVNADSLQAAQEQRMEDIGVEAIDHSKLHAEPDNEAMRYAIEQRRKRFSNQSGVRGARPGWDYKWMPVPGAFVTGNAKSDIRRLQSDAKREGYLAVQGDDPEEEQYKGNDQAAGTTMRGLMDCILMKIRIEDKILMEEEHARQEARRNGTFDSETLALAQRSGLGRAYHAAQNDLTKDPFMAKRVNYADAMPVSMTKVTSTFTEGDIRRGSIPGMPIGRQ